MSTSHEYMSALEIPSESPRKKEGIVSRRIGVSVAAFVALAAAVIQGNNGDTSDDAEISVVATASEHPEEELSVEKTETVDMQESVKEAEESVTIVLSPAEIQKCEEEARKFWKSAQSSLVKKGIDDALVQMDAVLAQASLTREDIQVTADDVKAVYLRLAKDELERAEYFRGNRFAGFQRAALSEMYASLTKAGMTLDEMGVDHAQQVAEMEAELATRVRKAN